MSALLIRAILPVSVLASSGAALSGQMSQGMGITAAAAGIYYLAALIGMTFFVKTLPMDTGEKSALISMSVFANTGFIGIPLAQAFLGAEGAMYAVIYNLMFQLFFYSYGMHLFNKAGRVRPLAVIKNPVTIVSLFSVAIFFSPFRFPAVIQSVLDSIGGMTTPLSMMIIGCTLVGLRPGKLLRDKYSYLLSAVRLLVFPLLMLLGLWLFRVPAAPGMICVMMTALPSGTLNVVMSQRYGCAVEYVSRAVVQTLLLMGLTVPLIMALAGLVLS